MRNEYEYLITMNFKDKRILTSVEAAMVLSKIDMIIFETFAGVHDHHSKISTIDLLCSCDSK